MSCILNIIGKDFDVDFFVAKSKLRGFVKKYKGDLRVPVNPKSAKLTHSSLSAYTSKAGFNNFEKQVKDTVLFLKKNKIKLLHIGSTKEIQYATISFGVELRIDDNNQFPQSFYLQKELTELCGELSIGIEISIYPAERSL